MDVRDHKPNFDLEKIDFEWVAATDNVRELKKALKALQDDKGGYVELEKAVEDKILLLDPSSKKPTNQVSPEEMKLLEQDLQSWSDTIDKSEKLLKDEPSQESVVNETLSEKAKETGNDYLRAKDYDQALESYTRAVSLNPRNAPAYFNRALVYLKQFKYRKAAEDCDKAILLNPDYTKAYHRRALALIELKEYEKALSDLKKVLETDPENEEANEKLKKCRDELSSIAGYRRIQITEAEDEEDEENPENEEPPEPEKASPEPQDNPEEKDPALESILALQSVEDVLKELERIKTEGNAAYREEDYDKALDTFTSAIQVIDKRYNEEFILNTPTLLTLSLALYNNRALVYSKLDLNHEAILDSKKVLKLDKSNSKALFRMGKCQVSRGNLEQASQSFKQLLEIEPKNEAAKAELKSLEGKIKESVASHIVRPLSPRGRHGSKHDLERPDKSYERRVSFRDEEVSPVETIESIKNKEIFKKADSVFPAEKLSDSDSEEPIYESKAEYEEEEVKVPKDSQSKGEISKAAVKNATEMAARLVVLDQPKNALMVESAAKSLKSNSQGFYEYLSKISAEDLKVLFEKTEFSVELLNQCVEACQTADLDTNWAEQFFAAIPSTCRFSTTIKFLSKSEKSRLQSLFQRLGSADLPSAYKLI